jgi:hypothetical protein
MAVDLQALRSRLDPLLAGVDDDDDGEDSSDTSLQYTPDSPPLYPSQNHQQQQHQHQHQQHEVSVMGTGLDPSLLAHMQQNLPRLLGAAALQQPYSTPSPVITPTLQQQQQQQRALPRGTGYVMGQGPAATPTPSLFDLTHRIMLTHTDLEAAAVNRHAGAVGSMLQARRRSSGSIASVGPTTQAMPFNGQLGAQPLWAASNGANLLDHVVNLSLADTVAYSAQPQAARDGGPSLLPPGTGQAPGPMMPAWTSGNVQSGGTGRVAAAPYTSYEHLRRMRESLYDLSHEQRGLQQEQTSSLLPAAAQQYASSTGLHYTGTGQGSPFPAEDRAVFMPRPVGVVTTGVENGFSQGMGPTSASFFGQHQPVPPQPSSSALGASFAGAAPNQDYVMLLHQQQQYLEEQIRELRDQQQILLMQGFSRSTLDTPAQEGWPMPPSSSSSQGQRSHSSPRGTQHTVKEGGSPLAKADSHNRADGVVVTRLARLSRQLAQLSDSVAADLADTVVELSDGTELATVGAMLAARSSYFRQQLAEAVGSESQQAEQGAGPAAHDGTGGGDGGQETKDGEKCRPSLGGRHRISLPGVSPAHARILLSFITTGTCRVRPEDADTVAQLANRVDLPDLADACNALAASEVNLGNALSMLVEADAAGNVDLQQELLAFVSAHADQLLRPAELAASSMSPSLLARVMGQDTLAVPSERWVYDVVVAWARLVATRQGMDVREVAAEPLAAVRLGLLTVEDLTDVVLSQGLIPSDQLVEALAYSARRTSAQAQRLGIAASPRSGTGLSRTANGTHPLPTHTFMSPSASATRSSQQHATPQTEWARGSPLRQPGTSTATRFSSASSAPPRLWALLN